MHYTELAAARAELTGPGGAFEIEAVEIFGQRLLSYKHAPPNIRAFWQSTAAFADRPYLVFGDETLTYAQAHAQ
ncbi:MAG: class I adenylate-forming enzyme family protein, partial [Polymorphobacter sp.]